MRTSGFLHGLRTGKGGTMASKRNTVHPRFRMKEMAERSVMPRTKIEEIRWITQYAKLCHAYKEFVKEWETRWSESP